MPGMCKFHQSWCKDPTIPSIEKWLREDPNSTRNAVCTYCKSNFSVEHAGIGAVKKHAAGVGHINAEKSANQKKLSFMSLSTSTTVATSSPLKPIADAQSSSSTPMRSYLQSEADTRPEILRSIDRVLRHSFLRDSEESARLFPVLFPDSTIAKQFQMRKDKLAYMATYRIDPYFHKPTSSRSCVLSIFFSFIR